MFSIQKRRWVPRVVLGGLLAACFSANPAVARAAEPADSGSGKDRPPADAILKQVARLELETAVKELVQVRSDLRKVATELDLLQGEARKPGESVADAAVERVIDQDPAVKKETEAIQHERERLSELEATIAGGRNSAIYKDALAKLSKMEKELAARRRKLRPTVEDNLRQRNQEDLQHDIRSHQERITFLKELEKRLLADVQRLAKEAGPLAPTPEERLRGLERDVGKLKALLEELLKK